ncbi:hypothetical protein NQ315_017160 [Exocentrus adspersus]|uniref:Etoposide-induced protein 2.4 n=1 Tax=Exocentrus adspersus TaxID=1586481 RepID=A0AAV8VHG3_9CUCU|nr:hypothetical protein NQ315_017160 [Exocentrus adspersus]
MDIKNISYALFKGFYDSIKGMLAVFILDKEIKERKLKRQSPTRTNSIRQKPFDGKDSTKKQSKDEDSKLMSRILQCAVFNGGVFLLSIVFFEYLFIPMWVKDTGEGSWSRTAIFLLFLYRLIWITPIFTLSKILNTIWFQDIADLAYRHSRGRPVYTKKWSLIGADCLFSIIIQLLFLLQAVAVSYIPIYVVGYILSFVQMCMLYSLYAFEYKWFNMGWEIHRRLSFIEANWPYFIGFGMPMTLITQFWDSWMVSGCVFSILFPFYIISGNEASPVISGELPLRFFAPTIFVSNCIFSCTIGSPQKPAKTQTAER